eukprot:gene2650-3847_t
MSRFSLQSSKKPNSRNRMSKVGQLRAKFEVTNFEEMETVEDFEEFEEITSPILSPKQSSRSEEDVDVNHGHWEEMKFPKELLKIPGNNKCADCDAPDPKWTSINLGILICNNCAACHKKLDSEISILQPVVDTRWTMNSLEVIQEKGNIASNEEFEFDLKNFKKPNEQSKIDERQKYIEHKYQKLSFTKYNKNKKIEQEEEEEEEKEEKWEEIKFPQELFEIPGNDKCADCNAPNPKWASTNLGVLICLKCSGCHRNMGSHISKLQSTILDTKWTKKSLKMIEKKGNIIVNNELEYDLKNVIKPTEDSMSDERQIFIEQKYKELLFAKGYKKVHHIILDEDLEDRISRSNSLPSLLSPKSSSPLTSIKRKDTKMGSLNNSQIGMVEYTGMIKITIIGARKLPASGMNNLDPYFVFQLGEQKIKSQIIHKSLNPYFSFEELMVCVDDKNHDLFISCFNDSAVKNDKLVCDANYSITDVYNKPNESKRISIQLQRRTSNTFKLFNKKTLNETKLDLMLEYNPFEH